MSSSPTTFAEVGTMTEGATGDSYGNALRQLHQHIEAQRKMHASDVSVLMAEEPNTAAPLHTNDITVSFIDPPGLAFELPHLLRWLKVDPVEFAELPAQGLNFEFEDLPDFVSWVNSSRDNMHNPDLDSSEAGSTTNGSESVSSIAPGDEVEESSKASATLRMPFLMPPSGWLTRPAHDSDSESSDYCCIEHSDGSEQSFVEIHPEEVEDELQD